jgi:hypothetical protein
MDIIPTIAGGLAFRKKSRLKPTDADQDRFHKKLSWSERGLDAMGWRA